VKKLMESRVAAAELVCPLFHADPVHGGVVTILLVEEFEDVVVGGLHGTSCLRAVSRHQPVNARPDAGFPSAVGRDPLTATSSQASRRFTSRTRPCPARIADGGKAGPMRGHAEGAPQGN